MCLSNALIVGHHGERDQVPLGKTVIFKPLCSRSSYLYNTETMQWFANVLSMFLSHVLPLQTRPGFSCHRHSHHTDGFVTKDPHPASPDFYYLSRSTSRSWPASASDTAFRQLGEASCVSSELVSACKYVCAWLAVFSQVPTSKKKA